VTIIAGRHSGMFLAGIQNNFLDAGLRRYDERGFGHLFLRHCTKRLSQNGTKAVERHSGMFLAGIQVLLGVLDPGVRRGNGVSEF